MDIGAAKAIEAIVIAALVFGFYYQQQNALKRNDREDADRKKGEDTSGTDPGKGSDKKDAT